MTKLLELTYIFHFSFQACQEGHLAIVEFLVDHGADIEAVEPKSGTRPLFIGELKNM